MGFCELEGDRLDLVHQNFPDAHLFVGDIWQTKDEIVGHISSKCNEVGQELTLITCTAPCQGMSKNGQGTLLRNIREGKRPKLDPRNRLILPALDIISKLRPKFVVFENVSEMRKTLIEDEDGQIISILDKIKITLGKEYVGQAYDVEFANYGIPQRRQRLITVYSRQPLHHELIKHKGQLIPPATHSRDGVGELKKWVPVADILRNFPPLDAKSKRSASNPSVPFHRVPVLDEMKYFWVANTQPGMSAFDNQCVECGYQGNQIHSNVRDSDGINRSSKETPLFCEMCKAMLPRPSTLQPDGTRRIMSGYTSAYKRMRGDLPSPALTRNFSYACSDQKVHPFENRVLSIAEALKIHSLSDYKYEWTLTENGKTKVVSDALIRLMIGESIPPKFLELLGRYLIETSNGNFSRSYIKSNQKQLFEGFAV